MLRMETTGGFDGRPYVSRGILVLHSELPRYPEDPEPSDSTIVGRAYVNLSSAGLNAEDLFQEGPGADRIETVHAFLRGTRVVIHLAPYLKDASPIMTGNLTGDGIAGTWLSTVENAAPVQGSFTMKRERTQQYSDSAATRATRGVRDWNGS